MASRHSLRQRAGSLYSSRGGGSGRMLLVLHLPLRNTHMLHSTATGEAAMHSMVPTRIRRSLLVVLLAALIAALPAATALAANPGKTFTFHNQVDTFVDVLPCTDIPYQITTTSNGVMHFQLRTLPDGTVVAQFTFTQTGTFTAVPVSGVGPTFTGTFTVWDG